MQFNAFNSFDPFLSVEDTKDEKVDFSLLENLSPTLLTSGQFPTENLGDSFMHLLTEDNVTPSLVTIPTTTTITRPTKLIAPPPMPKIPLQEEDDLYSDEEDDEDPKKVSKPLDPTRVWSEVFRNDSIVGDGQVTVKVKTRRDQLSHLLPDRLYCSLKYEIQLSAEGSFVQDLPFIIARVSVVDEEKFKIVKKNNKTVVKGDVESALTHPPNGAKTLIRGTMKVQFDSAVSYHHDKRQVCLQIAFYHNNELEQPILIMRSVPVKIFARKPNKKKPKKAPGNVAPAQKRKRDTNSHPSTPLSLVDEEQRPVKVAKIEPFNQFVSKLDELENFMMNCSDEDRKRAMGVMFSKMSEMMKILAPVNPYATVNQDELNQFNLDDTPFDLFLN